LGEVYHSPTVQDALNRVHEHNVNNAELFYIFVSEYAKLCVEQIVQQRCTGGNFITFNPPDLRRLLALLKQAHHSKGDWVVVRMSIEAWWEVSSGELVRFNELYNLIGTLRDQSGLDPEAFQKQVKVTLEMNEIRTAFILIEV